MPTDVHGCDTETEYWDGKKCCPLFNEVMGMLITNFVGTVVLDPEKTREVVKFILDTLDKFQKKYPPGTAVQNLEPEP